MNRQAAFAWWNGLAPRERALVAGATGLVLLALLWWVALGPAISTLRAADAQHRALDAQVAHMQRLQAQAKAMQSLPRQNPDEAMRQLEAAVRQQLGANARYSNVGDRVTVTLANVPAGALAQWLAQVRTNARAIPGEAHLTRNAGGGWDGSVVLALPAR
ncbi:type II secretion system protein M [Ramlibacter ginsenosidimutans]|uniref:Type II secretion system protein M n=1 Tax=Ramlibacter ginsenosidimutans TaxID=502333 RepID=A0A934TQI7_9BURK|nr:type II secretion system protein GspM [Ramlibacter ginsenosidimutans]MBK6005320.1 type II secretion system protein M [Ramlibacter ginsenosidimutans]